MREPTRSLRVRHHIDGCWYTGWLLDQFRDRHGQWRVVGTYSTAPGYRYVLAMPASECRALLPQS